MDTELGHARTEPDLDGRLFVSAVAKALNVLEAFYGSPEPLSLKEVSERTGLGRSATQRHLYTLKALGYLIQDPRTARFKVSLKTIKLANSYLISDELLKFSLPYLIETNKITDQTVNLYRPDDLSLILIQRVSGQQILNPTVTIGSDFPLYATAPGRAILAHAPESQAMDTLRRSNMRQITPYTNSTLPSVLEKIAEARRQGYASLNQEAVLGNLSLGAPIFDCNRCAIAAVSLSGSAASFSLEEFEKKFSHIVLKLAFAITTAAGGLLP